MSESESSLNSDPTLTETEPKITGELMAEPEPEYTEEQKELIRKRNKVQRVKVICLHQMGRNFLTNPSYMKITDKKKLLQLVRDMYENKPEDEIIKEFNEIVCENILDTNLDVSQYPVYKREVPKLIINI
jgi:hypothetical protein